MTLPDYEKLGLFYLGREYDPHADRLGDELLYDSRDLTTHAVCIGMTGSGKTGLCLALLEEAALDGIPAIAIDPKGDVANLMLTFPDLRAEDFKPWVDEGDAKRKELSLDEFAASTARTWRDGLARWAQDGERIERLREAAEVAVYTPGSDAGRPLSILRSFAAPGESVTGDATAMKEHVGAAVSGLLGLLGIDTDPIKSREHILLSAILDGAWREGRSPDLAGMIRAVQKPPFDTVGVFDLESFMPAAERTELAMRINGILASPGFESWIKGEPIDIQSLLFTPEGKPRISIVSIAHLNDAERMLVVTLVANELVAWMRRQPGTSSLRALFYMDEVFGYFPPVATPPSKLPMLTLMKQARAFGVGVVLATQNPVDLDYKGLGNAGTWMIGRLQTDRDRQRVIDGLLATDAAAGLDKQGLESLMSNLGQRTFLMRNVHDERPVLFRTRWVLSYLRGPMTLSEIRRLTPATADQPAVAGNDARSASPAIDRPIVEAGVPERFLAASEGTAPLYQPRIGARVRAHFVNSKAGLDAWEAWFYLAPLAEAAPQWSESRVVPEPGPELFEEPAEGARYGETPATVLSTRNYRSWSRELQEHVYRDASMTLMRCPALGLTSVPGGTEGEFRASIAQALREKRDDAVEAIREKFASRLAKLEERKRRAEQKVARERDQARHEATSAAVSVGSTLLKTIFGGRRSSAATAARRVSRASKERSDVAHAEADLQAFNDQIAAMNRELETEIQELREQLDPQAVVVESVTIRPRKADISVEDMALIWCP
jgi:hypothetical protein